MTWEAERLSYITGLQSQLRVTASISAADSPSKKQVLKVASLTLSYA